MELMDVWTDPTPSSMPLLSSVMGTQDGGGSLRTARFESKFLCKCVDAEFVHGVGGGGTDGGGGSLSLDGRAEPKEFSLLSRRTSLKFMDASLVSTVWLLLFWSLSFCSTDKGSASRGASSVGPVASGVVSIALLDRRRSKELLPLAPPLLRTDPSKVICEICCAARLILKDLVNVLLRFLCATPPST